MFKFLAAGLLFGTLGICLMANKTDEKKRIPNGGADDRATAQKHMADGNYRDALEIFLKLTREPESAGVQLVENFQSAVQCYSFLQRVHELDGYREEMVKLHPRDWRLLVAVAKSYAEGEHWGFLVAGEFQRGQGRGGGEWAQASERDRTRALQLMQQAADGLDAAGAERAQFFSDWGQCWLNLRGQGNAWRLQELTDLSQLPDYEAGYEMAGWYGGRHGNQSAKGAPVDADGRPVFYPIPESLEKAANDGQRWRWCLDQVVRNDASRRNETDWQWATFLHGQFGVQTMAQWGIHLPRFEDGDPAKTGDDPKANVFSLHTLQDSETIARLATGIKRFELPAEYNPLLIFQAIAERGGTLAGQAGETVAGIFEDRQQYDRAARQWESVIEKFGSTEDRQARRAQIVQPWGRFENSFTQPAGAGATVEFRFRNATQVEFTAQRVDLEALLTDVKAYLKSNPREFDWQAANLDSIGYDMFYSERQKYVKEKVAAWTTELDPRPRHFDRRITITTPLQKAGAFLVTAQVKGGNQAHILLWIDDLAIIRKPIDRRFLYFVADAVSGQPVANANLEFFGWRMEWNEQRKRNQIQTRNFAETTDAEGFAEADPKLFDDELQWLTIARTADGRLAHLGFQSAWVNSYEHEDYGGIKIYAISDRPIYRPDQSVKYKFWLRATSYTQDRPPVAVGKSLKLRVTDPLGNQLIEQQVQVDANGSVAGEYRLGSEAALGTYALTLSDEQTLHAHLSFRVEEYKKPEYEVTIESPIKPVMLGDTFSARIVAKYYFGGPVSQATVKYKVHRSPRDVRWYPVRRWDWLYGNGYGWFASDYLWYPGFHRWGCLAPIMPWWGWSAEPAELVMDEEAAIGPDGTVSVEIDTALAKALHADQDHEYSITAEVVDASRRTVVGTGKVLVARQPFRVYGWTDRGHYRIGDEILANFSARTADGQGVPGKAHLQLLKVTYQADGQPNETPVYEVELKTDEQGELQHRLKASEPGQYRLALLVDDGQGHVIEGAQLLVVMGQGFDGAAFRFNDLEIIADKAEYAPGETMKLLINTNRTDSTVLLWLRPAQSNYGQRPKVLRIPGKSTIVEVPIEKSDMPNFFVEATTVAAAKVHTQARNIVVPPEQRVLDLKIETSAPKYTPGAEAEVHLRVTGPDGKPFVGNLVLTMYDRAIEYISGGSNVTDIRDFFWKWTRSHYPQTETSLGRSFPNLYRPKTIPMSDLGVFGSSAADEVRNESFAPAPAMAGGLGGARHAAPIVMESTREAAGAAKFSADAISAQEGAPSEKPGGSLVEAVVRKDFSDAAYWNPAIQTDPDGTATLKIKMPENLTDWKLRAWVMGQGTRVAEASSHVVTAKNIMVRLQAPRFFVERDEVVLSAIVHNYLDADKQVQVNLQLSSGCLEPMEPTEKSVVLPAGGEVRVDWRVKAIREGNAVITMSALSDVESDAMQMTLPVFVHGILKTESFSGVIRAHQDSGELRFRIPEERRVEQSRVEIRYSPTLAGALVDALPYLVEYPYGCTEQTLNRFLPTVITQNVLKRMNLDLAAIRDKRTNLNSQEIGDDLERARLQTRWAGNPVFDDAEVNRMVKKGLMDLTAMQNSDGGWGWFSGYRESSWPHTTATVVHGLQLAKANQVALVPDVLENGIAWLQRYQDRQVALLQAGDRIAALPAEKRPANASYRLSADNLDALIYGILVDADIANRAMADYLFRDRKNLSLYGLCLTGLAFDRQRDLERRDMIVRNIDQFVVYDEENQTAYIDLPNRGNYWWYWYGDTIEANAQYLKLLTRKDPQDPKAAGLVKYLLNNRRHATYWYHTRDTAYCIEALAEYLIASGEAEPNQTIEIWLDGQLQQSVEITPQVLFQFDNSFVLNGADVTAGEHALELRRKGKGPLYFNAYVTNFTLEDNITRAGLEVKVNRKFYKLVQREGAQATVQGQSGQAIRQDVERWDRVELPNLSQVQSGDLIEVELEIDSKNDYEYVIFEDLKAAGCEAVDLQSGYTQGGLGAYVEFRDERVSFFMRTLARGKHSVSYRLRAETPGQFSALPARAWAMYAPELKGNSDELKLRIEDR